MLRMVPLLLRNAYGSPILGRILKRCTSLRWCDGVFCSMHLSAQFYKFTNIYPKRGISVNLSRLCEVGLSATKAGVGFNTFKEPVAQQLRAWRTESQTKSYIASETYFGVNAIATGIP